MDKKKDHTFKYAIIILCFIAVAVGIYLLFQEKTTTTSVEKVQDSISPVICKSSKPSFVSFFEDTSESSLYTVKLTFRGGAADKISLTYNGEYSSEENARYADASAHADYNIFMSTTSKNPESFSPSFSHTDSSMQINLFGEIGQLTSQTAKLFYIDSDTFEKLDFSSADEVVKNYEDKNFSCTFNK